MKTLVIAPGHGGHDPGAIGPCGVRESDVVLGIGNQLMDRLAALVLPDQLRVISTRRDDRFVSLQGQVDVANGHKADFFLALHCNSAANPSARGFEIFTTPGETESDKAATIFFNDYSAEFPGLKGRTDASDGDPDKEASFYVIRKTKCPAILFELEFIHNKDGERFLTDMHNRVSIVESLARSCIKFLRLGEEVEEKELDGASVDVSATQRHLRNAVKASGLPFPEGATPEIIASNVHAYLNNLSTYSELIKT